MVIAHRLDLDRGWFFTPGPEGDVVLSTHVRLGRNVAGYPFIPLLSAEARTQITEAVRTVLDGLEEEFGVFSDPLDQTALLLRERRLVDVPLQHDGDVFVRADQGVTVTLFDEDHVRVSASQSGWSPADVLSEARTIADTVDTHLPFAVSLHWGYMGPDPHASGAAVRASALLHLPALMDSPQAHDAVGTALAPGIAIKAFRSSGSHSLGNVYLLESGVHPGWNETNILDELATSVSRLVHYEREAREGLLNERRDDTRESVERALALLRNAAAIRADDAMQLLSWVRLGVALGLTDEIGMEEVTSLLFLSQKSHLLQSGDGPEDNEDDSRAHLLRRCLAARG